MTGSERRAPLNMPLGLRKKATMNVEIKKLIIDIQKALEPIARLNERVNTFINENPDFLKKLDDYLENWPRYHRDNWIQTAGYGWYLNWKTPIGVETALSKGKKSFFGNSCKSTQHLA